MSQPLRSGRSEVGDSAESFRCFLHHRGLQELWAYTGKSSVNDAVKRMFPGLAR